MGILHWERKAQPSSKRQLIGGCLIPSPIPRISSHSVKTCQQIPAGGSHIPLQAENCMQEGCSKAAGAMGMALLTKAPRPSLSWINGINQFLVFSSSGDHGHWSLSHPRAPWQGTLGASFGFICYHFSSLIFPYEHWHSVGQQVCGDPSPCRTRSFSRVNPQQKS